MKTHTLTLMAIVAVLAIAFTSCKKEDDPITVNEVTLNWATASLEPGDMVTLVATISPANAINPEVTWTSSDTTIATVVDGVVTGVAPGKATITAISDDGAVFDFCVITVVAAPEVENIALATPGWGATLGTVSFVSDKTWTVGDLTWSDAVVASICERRTTFNGGSPTDGFRADCRNNTVTLSRPIDEPPFTEQYQVSFEGSLFSMAAVVRFRKQLCPDGWRVPRHEDFVALHQALGGTGAFSLDETLKNKLVGNEWGGEFVGFCTASGTFSFSNHTRTGYYWSITQQNATMGHYMHIGYGLHPETFEDFEDHIVNPSARMGKGSGMTLRCVR